MAILKIRKYGTHVLREKAAVVEDFGKKTEKILRDMEDTLLAAGGLGLAAPQVGVKRRIFISWDSGRKKLFRIINPEISHVSGDEEIDMEGCLSFPDIFFAISRPKRITLSGFNPKGRKIELEASGVTARCFQHEMNHLDGVLIVDFATNQEKDFWKEQIRKLSGKTRA